jgi:hypothetical protein
MGKKKLIKGRVNTLYYQRRAGRADVFTGRIQHDVRSLLNDQVALNVQITMVTVLSIYFHFRVHSSCYTNE